MDIQTILSSVLDEAYLPNEYPALAALEDEWTVKRPFEGLRVLVATPIYRNTMTQYRALLAGGAKLLVGFWGMNDGEIVEFLKDNCIPVVTSAEMLEAESRGEFVDLVLDCAGAFAGLHPKIGFVELTRSGVQHYNDAKKPVYVADSGIVKRIETSLGTGDGYFRALEKLGYGESFEGKRLLVFGSGKVGSGIALQGVRRGCNVTVVTDLKRAQSEQPVLSENAENAANLENSANSADSATPASEALEKMPAGDFSPILLQNGVDVVDCHDYESVSSLIYAADFVVTATGVKYALAAPEFQEPLLSTTAILANMGVEDEYSESLPAERVLNKKGPLNFILEEPTHLKYIDTSLALHAALAELLVQEAKTAASGEGVTSESEAVATSGNAVGLRFPPQELEQRLLSIAIQDGVIGPEVCDMLGIVPSDYD
jgi:adenosylhomocysteinase